MRLRISLAVAALAAGLAVAGAPGEPGPAAAAAPGAAPPNIVVISADDQALSSFNRELMPRTFHKLIDRSTEFRSAIVSTPLCCPSRATFLSGQYGHNNGVLVNNYAFLLEKQNILPAWLQEAGYTTAHVGKYMNKYSAFQPSPESAPAGWDFWRTNLGAPKYFDFTLGEDGKVVEYRGKDNYLTNVLSVHALELARTMPEPFYLQVDHYAPHESASEENGGFARGCEGFASQSHPAEFRRFRNLRVPRPPSFNERDISDKAPARNLPRRFNERGETLLNRQYRCMAASVYGLDRAVAFVIEELTRRGVFDNTLFVFWSDNGFMFGEHRMFGKGVPYDASLRVPLVIKAPGARLPNRVDFPVSNVDLAPTLIDYAGGQPCVGTACRRLDGRSLKPLIEGQAPEWAPGRTLLFESDPVPRAHKLGGGAVKGGSSFFCAYAGLWDAKHSYVHSVFQNKRTRECEQKIERKMFDLEADPWQLRALGPKQAKAKRLYWDRLLLERLHCSGFDGAGGAPPCP